MNRKPPLLARLVRVLLILAVTSGGRTFAFEYLVSDRATNQILRYSADDGTYLGALIDDNFATNGGLFLPTAIAIGFEGDLFVSSLDLGTGDGLVLRYDVTTGAFLDVFASGLLFPSGLSYHTPSDTLLVGQLGSGLGDTNVIARYDADGSRLTDLAAGPDSGRTGMTIRPNGDLLVSSFAEGENGVGSILEFAFNPETNDFAYAGVFAQAAPLAGANGLVADADGDLYVASLFGQSVVKFDVEEGVVAGSTVLAQLAYPSGLLISPTGAVLATSLGNNNPADPLYPNLFPGAVFRYDPVDGSGGVYLVGGEEFLPTAIILRPLPGDLNGDGQLTVDDIDQLTLAVRNGSTSSKYDLNGDGHVDKTDRVHWVEQLKQTYFGDADLSGEFTSDDFVAVFMAGQYEDNIMDNSTWATGDWEGDGEFGSEDFIYAFQRGGYELGRRDVAAAVPEPRAIVLMWSALMGLGFRFRRRVVESFKPRSRPQ